MSFFFISETGTVSPALTNRLLTVALAYFITGAMVGTFTVLLQQDWTARELVQ